MSAVAEQIELRAYQVECVDGVRDLMHAGKRRVILVSPTGSGKRILALWWALRAQAKERDVMIVTNRNLLVEQPSADLSRMKIQHGIIMGGHEPQLSHRIQLATIQSLESRFLAPGGEELPPVNLLMVDEAHNSVESYVALLDAYPEAFTVLLTATPVGPQGKTLVQPGYADSIFEGVRNSQLIKMGFLLPTRVIAPSEPDLAGVRVTKKSEYAESALGKRIKEVTCFGNVFDEWSCFADRQTIMFAPGIDYANGLVHPETGDSFYARGISAAVISSRLKVKERDDILERFRNGEIRVLVSVDMLREGFDVPAASCAVDLQPNNQLRTYWQKVGRIKRPHEGQTEAIYIDMAGNALRHLWHPDDDPEWPTGDETTAEVTARVFKTKTKMVRCPKCFEMRRPAPKCPLCGYESQARDTIKVVRMGNGKMREIKAEEIRKTKKTDDERKLDAWRGALYSAMKTGQTLKQAGHICKEKCGQWPQNNWPLVPRFGSADWGQRVEQVISKGDLYKAFAKPVGAQT